jgi:hypothetical protein
MPHVTSPNNLPPRLRLWRLLFALNGAQAGSRHLIGPPPYPVRLGRKPITMATMASIVTTRMAAANISTSFSVAQSPRWLAPCAKYAPRCIATCIKAVWLAAWPSPSRVAVQFHG